MAQSCWLCLIDQSGRITNSQWSSPYFLIRYRNDKNYDNKTDATQEQTPHNLSPFPRLESVFTHYLEYLHGCFSKFSSSQGWKKVRLGRLTVKINTPKSHWPNAIMSSSLVHTAFQCSLGKGVLLHVVIQDPGSFHLVAPSYPRASQFFATFLQLASTPEGEWVWKWYPTFNYLSFPHTSHW